MKRVNESQLELLVPLYLMKLSKGVLRGRTRLQKLVFLSQQELKSKVDYDFRKAPFGPLSYELYSVMEQLYGMNFVNEDTDVTDSGNEVIIYELTKEGEEFLDFGLSKNLIAPSLRNAINRVFEQYGDMPYVELLDKVHTDYPDYVERIE